jgi:DNA polymerase-3 subunit chi
MTERVDFYILKDASAKQGWHFACRLTEKAYLRAMRVAVLVGSDEDARRLDDLLWTFSDRAFVPHVRHRDPEPADASTPVYVTAAADGGPGADLLVNLSDRLPGEPRRFARIAEIIDADAERKRQGRERFKCYRDLGVPLETHQLDAGSDI